MRGMRVGLVAVGVALALGCSGLRVAGEQLTGARMEVKEGADAKLPADFPLPSPAGGTLVSVLDTTLLGTRTTVAVFELASVGELEAALEPYPAAMRAAGLEVTEQDSMGNRVITGTEGKRSWTVTGTAKGDQAVVTVSVAALGT